MAYSRCTPNVTNVGEIATKNPTTKHEIRTRKHHILFEKQQKTHKNAKQQPNMISSAALLPCCTATHAHLATHDAHLHRSLISPTPHNTTPPPEPPPLPHHPVLHLTHTLTQIRTPPAHRHPTLPPPTPLHHHLILTARKTTTTTTCTPTPSPPPPPYAVPHLRPVPRLHHPPTHLPTHAAITHPPPRAAFPKRSLTAFSPHHKHHPTLHHPPARPPPAKSRPILIPPPPPSAPPITTHPTPRALTQQPLAHLQTTPPPSSPPPHNPPTDTPTRCQNVQDRALSADTSPSRVISQVRHRKNQTENRFTNTCWCLKSLLFIWVRHWRVENKPIFATIFKSSNLHPHCGEHCTNSQNLCKATSPC